MVKPYFKYVKYSLLCLLITAFVAAIIIFPERYATCCFQGFAMWAECVLPSLFPFMVITLLAVKTGFAERAALPLSGVAKKLRLPPAAAPCFILSACSGYPAGSRVLSEFYERGALTKEDCEKLSYLCSTSGPLFIIASVGFKMFGDKTAGFKILFAHVTAITVVSLIISLCSKKRETKPYVRGNLSNNALYDAFYGAVIAVTVAGGFIAFFYVFAAFCTDFHLTMPLERALSPLFGEGAAAGIATGLIEATAGCRALAKVGATKLNVSLAGFLITFGGVSILLQQLSYLTKSGVNPLKFIAVKFLQALVCFLILLLIA